MSRLRLNSTVGANYTSSKSPWHRIVIHDRSIAMMTTPDAEKKSDWNKANV
jgi:hypothetical protein